ncbi:MAG TPA: flagellar hook-basal body complex protein FliE [Polyangiales bacterium]
MAIPVKPMNFPTVELPKVNNPGKTTGVGSTPGVTGTEKAAGADFSQKLREALNEVNQQQVKAEKVADDYASGKQNDLHGTMITMTEADVQLRLTAQVRNKVIEAYREIMRMGS